MNRPAALLSLAVVLTVQIAACVSDTPGGVQGSEGGPCYQNGTCNAGLVCVIPNKCVKGAGEGGVDGGDPDTGGPMNGDAGDAGNPGDASNPGDAEAAAPCGAGGQACCALNTCSVGGCCASGMCYSSGASCPGGYGGTCTMGSCGGCGGLGLPCCSGSLCTAPASVCAGNNCAPCGTFNVMCCANNTCGGGLTCLGGFCK